MLKLKQKISNYKFQEKLSLVKLQQKSYTSDELGLNSRWQVVFRDPASFARASQQKAGFSTRSEEYSGRQKEKTGPQSFHHWAAVLLLLVQENGLGLTFIDSVIRPKNKSFIINLAIPLLKQL